LTVVKPVALTVVKPVALTPVNPIASPAIKPIEVTATIDPRSPQQVGRYPVGSTLALPESSFVKFGCMCLLDSTSISNATNS
jgi:hypothetical protein